MNFCWKFVDFLHFFSTTTPTPSRRRVVIFFHSVTLIKLSRCVSAISGQFRLLPDVEESSLNECTIDQISSYTGCSVPKISATGYFAFNIWSLKLTLGGYITARVYPRPDYTQGDTSFLKVIVCMYVAKRQAFLRRIFNPNIVLHAFVMFIKRICLLFRPPCVLEKLAFRTKRHGIENRRRFRSGKTAPTFGTFVMRKRLRFSTPIRTCSIPRSIFGSMWSTVTVVIGWSSSILFVFFVNSIQNWCQHISITF